MGEHRPGVTRVDNTVTTHVPLFSDGGGNAGSSDYAKAKNSLHADGKKIFAGNDPLRGDSYTVPAGRRYYKLAVDVSPVSAQTPVSTRVTAVWTFASAQSPGVIPPSGPVTVVRFTPTLPTGSTAKAGTTLTVPFSLQGAAPKADSLRKLAFAVSYDNGRTWHRTTAVQGKQQLKLRSPATPGPVSLRATLTDAKANTLTQTIHSPYRTTK
ncbi:hypothetical protein M2160_008824 [Streptomyces sp. SAI-117]|uniref:hypothetical protein n=1 Tax=unclassified Streptomyces TaxID=2593676 RepID=UPI002476EED7|nr:MULTISPECIES: hypothetical protein [unclassified Streptomyces]MDH6573717.1 hypothetical protein [Streptomyces sp. SAI-117]MDH6581552.1 hypothetical protein [Streptomyces sp. SAI-133]